MGAKDRNHSIQVNLMPMVFSTRLMASRFGARPVKNMVLVTQVVASATHMM